MADHDWRPALAAYAERMHALAGDRHHVLSPLGAWLLVALCGGLADEDGPVRSQLADALGGHPGAAAEFAAELLADPHPVVGAGAGVWMRPAAETARLAAWRAGLPSTIDTGDIPSQRELDQWAAERTMRLIERFPVKVAPDDLLLLASALATKVSWEVPFAEVDASELAPSPWVGRIEHALRSPVGDPRHRAFVADSDRAGRVAVHMANARGGLQVVSVIAVDPAVVATDVLAVAEWVGQLSPVSLFDLPLGDGPVWTIDEEAVEWGGNRERVGVLLPPWSAKTDLDLDSSLGFAAAAAAINPERGPYAARQTALARYTAVGFEAAAVTAFAVGVSAPTRQPGRRRTATLRFGHPFAVVAFVRDTEPGPWRGLPVFSAWVSEP